MKRKIAFSIKVIYFFFLLNIKQANKDFYKYFILSFSLKIFFFYKAKSITSKRITLFVLN